MKKFKGNIKMKTPYKGVFLILIVLVCVFFLRSVLPSDNTLKGQTYIKKLEAESITTVKKKVMKKRVALRKLAIEDGKLDVYSLFEDYVFLGDSRVMGYKNYNLLDSTRVMADTGANIQFVDQHLDEIKNLQPSTVILSYGVNDMGLDLNSSEGGYGALYEKEVNKILEVDPDAKIYICSIIPCTPATLESSPRWGNTTKYNAQLKKICKKNKWTYIDCTSLADGGNADIYQDDGIHFLSPFYQVWANTITSAILENEE